MEEEYNARICKRCLTRELAGKEQVYETLKRYIEDLTPDERVSSEIYESRLERCKKCDYLLEGMCRACGCYVELRAAMSDKECSYNYW